MGEKLTTEDLTAAAVKFANKVTYKRKHPADWLRIGTLYTIGYQWGYSEFYSGKLLQHKIINWVIIDLATYDSELTDPNIKDIAVQAMNAGYNLGFSDKNNLGFKA
ncbi:MAG: hypothetical protein ABW007_02160 [Chitinophagaceae bacterium]